jgi:hypothetical protein
MLKRWSDGPDSSVLLSNIIFQHCSPDHGFHLKSNDVGRIADDAFKTWEEKQNDVTLELDTEPWKINERSFDVYVGGPAALCAAAIQVLGHKMCQKWERILDSVF